MATQAKKVTKSWEKIANAGQKAVIQNVGENFVEIATVASGNTPSAGFILDDRDVFSYPGGDEVWIRAKNVSFIIYEVI